MSLLYVTSDVFGQWTGGSKVVTQELQALKQLSDCDVISQPNRPGEDVWDADQMVFQRLCSDWEDHKEPYKLVHLYAGTFGKSIRFLKEKHKAKVCYTVAAHDVGHSRKAHEDMGMPFNYPHLTDPKLWKRYAEGYLELADLVICPGTVPAETVRKQGRTGRIEIVPHGCDLPSEVKPLPKTFRVGYLGNCGGPDKGLRYLLEAWKKLKFSDAILVLGGKDSTSDWTRHLINTFGGGNIQLMGWVNDVVDFYNSISVMVVPAVTEGFNCECLEAMAYQRMSICSTGAGASDLASETFPACDVDALCSKISYCKSHPDYLKYMGEKAAAVAAVNTWDIVRERYKTLWKEILSESKKVVRMDEEITAQK